MILLPEGLEGQEDVKWGTSFIAAFCKRRRVVREAERPSIGACKASATGNPDPIFHSDTEHSSFTVLWNHGYSDHVRLPVDIIPLPNKKLTIRRAQTTYDQAVKYIRSRQINTKTLYHS